MFFCLFFLGVSSCIIKYQTIVKQTCVYFKTCNIISPVQVFTIFAFATTGGYSGTSHITVTCSGSKEGIDIKAQFGYPFRYCEILYNSQNFQIVLFNVVPNTKVSGETFIHSSVNTTRVHYYKRVIKSIVALLELNRLTIFSASALWIARSRGIMFLGISKT